ncbi:hypothetical protein VT98_11363 [Candidatus Electrothrix communis]|uniref:DUF3616 domain-containing protein n=1 Tax=Candidatus Electrothrix communis TaxID=1859133 RepID=A0A444J637_9BACT|nr:DUF3616 domain-containing protein [Desulfobulbus sp. US4]RWX48555.1 hypothetical protein VT98_11363 [Candidatus Electrothrix communis]WLE95885.1 MAG: DUF3616 domain-containing protein [Candidatus Electrothrix communis]
MISQQDRERTVPLWRAVLFYAVLSVFSLFAPAIAKESRGRIESGPFIRVSGEILAGSDISAVAVFSSFLVIGSDEAVGVDNNENYIQLLRKIESGYAVHKNILLLQGDQAEGKELDIEGIAVEGDSVYIVGAHCLKRQKVKKARIQEENRKKFQADRLEEERNRAWLYRIRLDKEGNEVESQRISLREIIKHDPVLHPFSRIPSKENGIDIEGVAAKDGWLYVGFRGPVLRENYIPVMKLKFDDAEKTYELLYVQLGGRGIRDITKVSDGFLILAGPVGDGDNSYQLYHWDGKDLILGKDLKDGERGRIHFLGDITSPKKGKVEGVAVHREEETGYQLILAYDGAENNDTVLQYVLLPRP